MSFVSAPLPLDSQPARQVPADRLAYADGLRAVAALWVFMFHASKSESLGRVRAELPATLNHLLFEVGDAGVSMFFVLSGFVMALTVGRAAPGAPWTGRFLLRRLVRLTPPYQASIVLSLLVALGLSLRHGGPLAWPDASAWAAHVFYLQDFLDIPSFNVVYWTLVLELQFYVAFAALIWLTSWVSRRSPAAARRLTPLRVGLFIATGLASAAYAVSPAARDSSGSSFALLWFNFAAGALSYWAWKEGGRVAQAACGYGAILALCAFASGSPLSHYLLCAAVVALTLLVAGRSGRMSTWLSWAPIQRLASVSYSFYLVHAPLMGLGFALASRWLSPGWGTELIGLAVSFALCALAAGWLHRCVEVPSQRWSRMIPLGPIDAPAPALGERSTLTS